MKTQMHPRRIVNVMIVALAVGSAAPLALAQLGVPISAPVALNTNAASDAVSDFSPQVATDGAGHWVAVWDSQENLGGTIGTDEDIFVSRSIDNGLNWSPPVALNTNAATDAGNDVGPQVATDAAGNWVAVWHSNDNLGRTIGTDPDIFVSRSTDNGATWSPPAPLNTNAASDVENDQFPQVATDGTGHWVAVWRSRENLGGTIGTDFDIFVSRSTDNGLKWSRPVALNTNADSDAGNDVDPQVATDVGKNWVAVWESSDTLGGRVGTDEDIFVSRSTDNGLNWSPPAPLNTNAASDVGVDLSPQVTTDAAGHWVTVWTSFDTLGGTIGTDEDILVSRSTNDGVNWSPPVPLNTNATSDAGDDERPQVATDGVGNWLALWDSTDTLGGTVRADLDIFVARSTDNGATWSPPAPLNTNAASDPGGDLFPQVATDRAGNWLALWLSTDTLGGTIGTDLDIFVARFALPDCNTNGLPDGQDIASGTSDDCNVDGVPDECTMVTDGDDDTDEVINACDNCPDDANPDQADADNDGLGDACDNCPDAPNTDQADTDNDSVGNACDNCPDQANLDQSDDDVDGFGDPCDNCPNAFNPDQTDADNDGFGDLCEPPPPPAGPCGAGVGTATGFFLLGLGLMRFRTTGRRIKSPQPARKPEHKPAWRSSLKGRP
jgi:hypothetical protein